MAARASFRDIKAELSRRIATREWPPGALIPGEEQLAGEFGSARATVNRALQELARSGVLERKRKAGTRVALHPVREARFAIPIVRHEIEAKGAAYGYALIERSVVAAPDHVRARLALGPGARTLHVRCLHLSDRAPYQAEERWISLETVPEAESEPFRTMGPNEWLVGQAPFSRAEFVFRAARATADEAGLLGVPEGEALFIAERTTFLGERGITFVRMAHPPGHRIVTEI